MSAPAGVEIAAVIVTFAPLTVPPGVIEAAGGSFPLHFDTSSEEQTKVVADPVKVFSVCVKFV